MKKVLSFVLIACVTMLTYSCGFSTETKTKTTTTVEVKEGISVKEIKKIVITAYLDIKTDKVDKFLTEVQEVIDKSKAEDGNASYNLFADLKEKNKFVFVEEWKGQAAVDIHFATEHFKKFNTLMEEVAASPAKIKIFEVVNEK